MNPVLIYCYDAYCGWCYGFSPVIKKLADVYRKKFAFEVLSGGMIISENPKPISVTAEYIRKAYKTVEERTGIAFGQDYLWHIFNPDESDWHPDSLKPAVALCIFKEFFSDQQITFAADLQYALHFEGRDLTDNEAYRHLLDKYLIPADDFYEKLNGEEYKEKARLEFALVKQLKVSGFPTVLIQTDESKFYLAARGYTDYATVDTAIKEILEEIY